MTRRLLWTVLAATLACVGAVTPVRAAAGAVRHGSALLALRYKGRPYVWGAAGPYAFDCSGLVRTVYRRHGLALPRTADAMYHSAGLRRVSRAQVRRDDLVFWSAGGYVYHVGIYLGGGRVVHTGDYRGVRIAPLWGRPLFKRPRALSPGGTR
ncbi:glycoside hydrolase [Pilimelia anulata]|uniref:Glycoside hydrolase n=1 Tax=Pilimelia anulata TaxID=53371 RepID=A0A8J3B7E1_9ACTN|nr:C40 family peptidase [Pilimelia anulata]GGJ81306.1 glycoside hydrolase [Pilimelia anulata]